MKKIESLIRSLKGVIALEKLEADHLTTVKTHCPLKEQNGFADIVYVGLEAVLGREEVWVLLKDAGFRPPPGKTVYMVEDVEEKAQGMENILSLGERQYHIIGEEIFKGEKEPEEAHFLLSDGFLLFTERRNGTRHLPAYFLLPPIPFPELEERKEAFGIRNIVSVSPSAASDMILRNLFEFDLSPEYATILIGMDRQETIKLPAGTFRDSSGI
jgi:hypothetical protein